MNTNWTNDRHWAHISIFLYIPGELGQWYGYWLLGFVALSSPAVVRIDEVG